MGPSAGRRSKIKRKSIMMLKSCDLLNVALLGLCVACVPLVVSGTQLDEGLVVEGASEPLIDSDSSDLLASETQNIGLPPQRVPLPPPSGLPRLAAVPTSPIPVAVPPPPSNSPLVSPSGIPTAFTFPKTDLFPSPSYAPRYVVPPISPWSDRLPYEVASFRRRASEDDAIEDDHQPQESKGKKSSPSFFKRIRNGIRNTGKAIVGAPSYIIRRYRKTYFGSGGGGKKKAKGGWKGWSAKQDNTEGDYGWGGWEEYEPSGYDREHSHYPSEKGSSWKGGKGFKDYDSHERRYDRESSSYRDYREKDKDRDSYYKEERERPARRHREKPRYSYREETHYDDYDGRRTTAYYGPPDRKSPPERTSERPSERPTTEKKRPYSSSTSSSGNYKYDDDY